MATPDIAALIDRATKIAGGSYKELAQLLGVRSSGTLRNVRDRGVISAELALSIHWVTHGVVSASDLRPDLWTRPDHVPRRPKEFHHGGQRRKSRRQFKPQRGRDKEAEEIPV